MFIQNHKFCRGNGAIFERLNSLCELLSLIKMSLTNENRFPVWLRNQLLSAGLEPVLSQTEKSCISYNYRQFSTNFNIKIIKLITVLLA